MSYLIRILNLFLFSCTFIYTYKKYNYENEYKNLILIFFCYFGHYQVTGWNVKILPEIEKKKIRIGGMVKINSISMKAENIKFVITDFKNEVNVIYSGVVPNLFTEGKGVVAEGYLKDKNFFLATKILAKHDENYMPPEVKAVLEEK